MVLKREDYFEEEPQLRVSGGMFASSWKRLLTDHLNDCYRQRRVFREALNDMREEFIGHADSMHQQNQAKMDAIEKQIEVGATRLEAMQKWIFSGIISILLLVLGWFVTHFGPFAGHVP